MKEKIFILIIGILVGAIITTSVFLIFEKNNRGDMKMMERPERPSDFNGQSFEKQDGTQAGEIQDGEKQDRTPPSEMQDVEKPSGETPPEKPEGSNEKNSLEKNSKDSNTKMNNRGNDNEKTSNI